MSIKHSFDSMIVICVVSILMVATAHAQKRTPDSKVLDVCSVLKRARYLNGQFVRIRGKVEMGMETLTILDSNCNHGVWIELPEADQRRPNINDDEMKEFKDAVSATAPEEPLHPCSSMHCMQNDVVATLQGKLNYRSTYCREDNKQRGPFKCGYGHLGEWNTQIVVTSVSDVEATKASASPTH